LLLVAMGFCLLIPSASAGSKKVFELKDGTAVVGVVLDEGATAYLVRTSSGKNVRVLIEDIVSVEQLGGSQTPSQAPPAGLSAPPPPPKTASISVSVTTDVPLTMVHNDKHTFKNTWRLEIEFPDLGLTETLDIEPIPTPEGWNALMYAPRDIYGDGARWFGGWQPVEVRRVPTGSHRVKVTACYSYTHRTLLTAQEAKGCPYTWGSKGKLIAVVNPGEDNKLELRLR